MKRKMKKLLFSAIVFVLLLPTATFAQLNEQRLISSSELPVSRDGLYGAVQNLMQWLLGIFGFIGIIGFVIAGIWYLTAAGDETQIERAKKAMIYSIIGVIVGLIGLVIIFAVDKWLRGNSAIF
ncbi:MAG TPA: hypothetical protein VJH89_02325 [Patescibacteria group bacterium]|nr:hypothetical protein [Patescibacteria group bacterium]